MTLQELIKEHTRLECALYAAQKNKFVAVAEQLQGALENIKDAIRKTKKDTTRN